MYGIDKVYVLHCKRGYEARETSIRNQFEKHAIPFEFILDWDISDLTPEIRTRFDSTLTEVSVSVCMKHFEAMKRAVANQYRRILVFEDDIFLFPNFIPAMEAAVRESLALPHPHCVYLSNSCNKYTPRSQRKPGQRLYEQDHSRAADAYLLSLDICTQRLAWLADNWVKLPIDHLYTQIDRQLGNKMYWLEDPMCEQGSMNGSFPSAVDNHHSLWVQRWRWKLDKFYRMNILRNLR